MQAAGRMQLAQGQSVCFIGAEDVSSSIRSASHAPVIASSHVLSFALNNTVANIDNALCVWAHPGGAARNADAGALARPSRRHCRAQRHPGYPHVLHQSLSRQPG
jgi:hypothetical protein